MFWSIIGKKVFKFYGNIILIKVIVYDDCLKAEIKVLTGRKRYGIYLKFKYSDSM